MRALTNILQLGIKELRSLARDPALVILIVYAFSLSIYSSATAIPEAPYRATIGVVNEDPSPLSYRILDGFQLPYFVPPEPITHAQMDTGMDEGLYTFTLNIPPDFQRDLLGGRQPAIQLNVDATQVSQAFTGAGHIQKIINSEVNTFLQRYRGQDALPVEAVVRMNYNPNLDRSWFGAINSIIDQITMLSIMGGNDLIVPRGVRVEVNGTAVLGGDDVHIDEDAVPADSPTVRVRTFSFMGGNDVRHPKPSRHDR